MHEDCKGENNMGYTKPVPVKKEDIKVGNQYYTCNYSGTVTVTVIKILDKGNVLVKTKKSKPFVRELAYIFDDPEMAKFAGRDWEKAQKKQ